MLLDIYLPLFLIPLSLCSMSVRRIAKNNNVDASLQKRAQPVSADQLSLYTFNTSATDAEMVRQTSLGHNYQIVCQRALRGLDAQDCFTALRQSPTGEAQESWATTRSPPSIHADVRVPIRLFSGEYQTNDEIEVINYLHVLSRRRNVYDRAEYQKFGTELHGSSKREQCD